MQRRPALFAALALLPLGLQAQRAEYQFVRAEYGARRRQIDVSATVVQLVQRGQSVAVSNALFGTDPAPGERKRLRVIGRDRRGRERAFDIEEDGWFDASAFSMANSPVVRPTSTPFLCRMRLPRSSSNGPKRTISCSDDGAPGTSGGGRRRSTA